MSVMHICHLGPRLPFWKPLTPILRRQAPLPSAMFGPQRDDQCCLPLSHMVVQGWNPVLAKGQGRESIPSPPRTHRGAALSAPGWGGGGILLQIGGWDRPRPGMGETGNRLSRRDAMGG